MMEALRGSRSTQASQVEPTPTYIQPPAKTILSFWCFPVGIPRTMTRCVKDRYVFDGIRAVIRPLDET